MEGISRGEGAGREGIRRLNCSVMELVMNCSKNNIKGLKLDTQIVQRNQREAGGDEEEGSRFRRGVTMENISCASQIHLKFHKHVEIFNTY